ncbi:hypothetical protein WJX75_003106 [Coccomyxa subellipsoidea]|uniref:P-loop containing nucleoside triphosphate hydrolase protein n=1 Tax=Coccomyxa subellipsoidea TaxID=248742 RepID=A0ABR2YB01_9CHLO
MNSNHARTVLHIDLDCFYCQVEQKRLSIPRNVPVAVQQWEGLIAINYAARAAGITRHMRVHEAKALCPELQCVHVETIGGDELDTKDRTKQKACLERYRKACLEILAVLHKAAPQAVIEKASIDEVYMDVTTMVEKELRERAQADTCREAETEGEGGAHDWEAGGSPVDAFSWGSIVLGGGPLNVGSEFERRLSIGANIACRLRGAVREQLGFTCSAGIAANKLLAKVASAMNKPNQQTIVPPRAVDEMMRDLPLKKLRNFGGKLGAELAAMGCATAGQVAALPHAQLTARFGEERAAGIARAVRGYSDEPVQVKELAKSMLAAKSFNPTSAPAQLDRWMRILAEELSHRLTEDGIAHSRAPRSLSLSYRGSNGDRSKCGPVPRPTKEGYTVDALMEAGCMLMRKCHDIYPCARLALQASDFYDLPLSDDQGAISRFLTSTPGDGDAALPEAPKPKKSGPQQPSIAQMFKRAAAAKAPVQGTPPDQSGAIAASAQPAAQNFYPQSAADRGGSDTKPSGTPEVPIRSPREQEAAAGSPADAERPCEGTLPVVFQLERFVEALSACLNAKFSFVFFKEHEALWHAPERRFGRLLRSLVQCHLRKAMQQKLLMFDSWHSADWYNFLKEVQPSFIMLSGLPAGDSKSSSQTDATRMLLRAQMVHCLAMPSPLAVAFLPELRFHLDIVYGFKTLGLRNAGDPAVVLAAALNTAQEALLAHLHTQQRGEMLPTGAAVLDSVHCGHCLLMESSMPMVIRSEWGVFCSSARRGASMKPAFITCLCNTVLSACPVKAMWNPSGNQMASKIDLLSRGLLSGGETSEEEAARKAAAASMCLLGFKEAAAALQTRRASLSSKKAEFQLALCGNSLQRDVPADRDPRVLSFNPDPWQRKVLDAIDAQSSVVVCAPTSAGKTFISYYCMDRVLRGSKDGKVVFVAPTKALVNQVAAQVAKDLDSQTTDVVHGVFTRDFRYNALEARILVTVPACLEILLLSPTHRDWVDKLQYIIFDEVHCMREGGIKDGGANEGNGAIIEHSLLIARCPVIALSATIGNPQEIASWLCSAKDLKRQQDAAIGTLQSGAGSYAVALIQHGERYGDLRYHSWQGLGRPDEGLGNATLPAVPTSAQNGDPIKRRLHPCSVLTIRQLSQGFPSELSLEPMDSLQLFRAMQDSLSVPLDATWKKTATATLDDLAPAAYFPASQAISRTVAWKWGGRLKAELAGWAKHEEGRHAACKVLSTLGGSKTATPEGYFLSCFFNMLQQLNQRDMLPLLVFSFDRRVCEDLAEYALERLEAGEEDKRTQNAGLDKQRMVEARRTQKAEKRARDQKSSRSAEPQEDTAGSDSLDEDEPDPEFSFAGRKKIGREELEEVLGTAGRGMEDPKNDQLIRALTRGIGVPHSGLPEGYRQSVEILFRCGHLRVVIATGTLAYGINMPCRSVAFAGDHIFLNALQFRQMTGRAGRRGFDTLGHVIFLGVPPRKMASLLLSPVPTLHGNFPLSVSLVLRMLSLVAATCDSSLRKKADLATKDDMLRVLQRPFYAAGKDPALQQKMQHLFRFAVDYLMRQRMLTLSARPVGMAKLSMHLFWSEPSNFTFASFLRSGVFHRICAPMAKQQSGSSQAAWVRVSEQLLLMLSHMFERIPLHRAALLAIAANGTASTVSKVVLEPLSPEWAELLQEHNAETMDTLHTYSRAWWETAACLAGDSASTRSLRPLLACQDIPLNRYIVDYWSHRQKQPLIKGNGLREGSAWNGLNSFCSILAAISTAMEGMRGSDDVVVSSFRRLSDEYKAAFRNFNSAMRQ